MIILLEKTYKKETAALLIYTFLYFGYLFIHQESESIHWLTLVILPFLVILLVRFIADGKVSITSIIESNGISKRNISNGMLVAIILGIAFCFLQLAMFHNKVKFHELLESKKIFFILPVTLLLLVFTAAFTEEFFFRGILQARLQFFFKSKIAAILVASIFFSFYHLPYAYLSPHWPSYGNLSSAFALSFSQGMPVGIIIGLVYSYNKNNLAACILLHALIDLIPAMTSIKLY